MGCRSDYLNPTENETVVSVVYSLLDELETKELNKNHYRGYHPDAYTKQLNYQKFTESVQQLCAALTNTDVTQYSLEMQMWWREHQEADRKRKAKEEEALKLKNTVDAVWDKLTYEEQVLIADSYIYKREEKVFIVPKGWTLEFENGVYEVKLNILN